MDHLDRLRRLAATEVSLTNVAGGDAGYNGLALESDVLALVRLAALIAMGGGPSLFGSLSYAAVESGVTAPEIVDVLIAVAPIVGLHRVIAAAPKVALALGYDMDALH
jgi:alkylhydroperoxidase/carboxymuconolactone decarboxylase family protein YurZ